MEMRNGSVCERFYFLDLGSWFGFSGIVLGKKHIEIYVLGNEGEISGLSYGLYAHTVHPLMSFVLALNGIHILVQRYPLHFKNFTCTIL